MGIDGCNGNRSLCWVMLTRPIESHHPGKFVLLSLLFVTINTCTLYLLLSQYFSSLLLWLHYQSPPIYI